LCITGANQRRGVENDAVSNHDPDSVDWLDLGPDPDEGRTPPDPRRRYLWYGAAAALVAVALVLTQTQHGTNRAATSPHSPSSTATPSRTVSSSPASSSSGSFVDPTAPTATPNEVAAVPRGRRPKVTSLGHPLLHVPADWELFARGPNVVVRIQLALGRVTTTPVPVSGHDAPVTFFVGSDRAFVRSLDASAGYVVRDGKAAAELPPSLRHGGWMLPSLDGHHLWTDVPLGDQYGISLVQLDGSPTGIKIDVPMGAGVQGSDDAGYLMLSGIGGVYDVRPNSVHRITSGTVLAGGPTRWLAVECDDSLTCANVVIDRPSGTRHTLDTPVDSLDSNSGTISPDGRTAAMPRHDVTSSGIGLIDLDSGAARPVEVTLPAADGYQTGSQMVWSPDSQWLFAPDDAGRVMVINRATGRATPLGTRLPPVDQLALRRGGG
jgi:hypothetical protein